ncbi:MAG: beta-propeller domain-containing protein [Acidimicrobiales bacterium]
MWAPTRKLLAGGMTLALLAGACGSDLNVDPGNADGNGNNGTSGNQIDLRPGEFSLTGGLATFNSCDSLLTHLRTEGADRVGPYGFNHGGYWFGPDIALEEFAVDDAASDGDAGGRATASTAPAANFAQGEKVEGEDFSGTNNQETGVDEPDIVKTDGDRILTVTNGVFTYTNANDGDPVKRGSVRVGYESQDMLVVGDRVLLFGVTWGEGGGGGIPVPLPVEPAPAAASVIDESGDAEASFAADDVAIEADIIAPPGGYYGPRVRIIELDVSNPDDIDMSSQLLVDGFYLSARLVGDTVTVAIQSDPTDLGFVYPQGPSGEERAEQFNKEIVGETELSDWLPGYTLERNGERTDGLLTECSQVHAPENFAGFGSLSVVSIDMNDGLGTPETASVLAAGQTVYASTGAMWIATNEWIDWGILDDGARRDAERSFSTQIHGFSIGDDDGPSYLASGSVRGHLLNQFAMSEHDDVLRVASTDGTLWGANEESESFVTTFGIDAEEHLLEQLGQVGDMGKGERIFSVRFVEETAYVVTFRQTDPFYTVDLSDPNNPRVLGELKITGYSGQLHPLSANLVLGIGQEATEEGRTTGAKVTLFDVSDLANPIDLDTWTVPNAWTNAEFDHKAFLWWAPENLAVLPIQSWEDQFFGAVALHIDLDAGTIAEAGRISHDPKGGPVGVTECSILDADSLEQFKETNSPLAEIAWEAEWVVQEGGQVQLCGDGEAGATGLHCERWFGDEAFESELGDGAVEVCWPEGPGSDPINRTLVIGDTLWSLSWSRLQANDLGTFEPGNYIELT